MTLDQTVNPARRVSPADRLAFALSEIFAPVVLIIVLLLLISVQSSPSTGRGLLIGSVAAFFVGVLPYAVMLRGIRRGRLGDRHLSDRAERPAMMAFGLVSAGIGLGIVRVLDAPRDVYALLFAMVAGIAVALAVSLTWKISIHAACLAGTWSILYIVYGQIMFALLPLPLLTGWARVHRRDHTVAQVIAGLAVGALVAAVVFAAVRT